MKKIVPFICLLFLSFQSFGAGIPITDIPRLIMEYITDQVLMEQDREVQQEKMLHLLEVLQKAKNIRARHTDVLGLEEDLEKELRLVREVQHLKLNDILSIADKVLSVTGGLYARDLPVLEEYQVLREGLPGIESSNHLYDYFHGGTSVYSELTGNVPDDYAENGQLLREQAFKQYALEVDVTKRSLHTALAYQALSQDLLEQAADLGEQVNKDGRWELTGIGDIFSDLLDGQEGAEFDPNLGGLEDLLGGWAKEIKESVFGIGNAIGNLFDRSDDDKEEEIDRLVSDKVGGFDFGSLLESLLGGSGNFFTAPSYQTQIQKEGMGLSTGERIEAQGAALDNLKKSLDLQLEADQIILNAIHKTISQQQVDASYQNALMRESMAQAALY
jgi:hypothetical protein